MKLSGHILFAALLSGYIVECYSTNATRKSLQFNGAGYLIYSSNIHGNISSLIISGTFSAKSEVTNQIVVAVEDKNGEFMGYSSISTQEHIIDGNQGCHVWSVSFGSKAGTHCLTAAKAFSNFTTTLSVTVDNTVFKHSVETKINNFWNVKATKESNARKWNFENVKLYIGGYKTSVLESSQFTGCVSDVFVNGTNVITTYLNQSPNHANPAVHGGTLPDNATECNYETVPTPAPTPQSTIPSTTAQTKSGATDMTSISKAFVTVCVALCVMLSFH